MKQLLLGILLHLCCKFGLWKCKNDDLWHINDVFAPINECFGDYLGAFGYNLLLFWQATKKVVIRELC